MHALFILLLFLAFEKVKVPILHRSEDNVRVHEIDSNCTHSLLWSYMDRTVTISAKDVLPNRQWNGGTLTINLKENVRNV